MSDNESHNNRQNSDEAEDLESQLLVDIDGIKVWIERLPEDVKSALQKQGGDLFPSAKASEFKFPESLTSYNKEVMAAFGNGGRLWLLARMFKMTWPYSSILAKDIFEMDGVGDVLESDLMKLKQPIAIRMMRFLLSCKEFRQGVQAISLLPSVASK